MFIIFFILYLDPLDHFERHFRHDDWVFFDIYIHYFIFYYIYLDCFIYYLGVFNFNLFWHLNQLFTLFRNFIFEF